MTSELLFLATLAPRLSAAALCTMAWETAIEAASGTGIGRAGAITRPSGPPAACADDDAGMLDAHMRQPATENCDNVERCDAPRESRFWQLEKCRPAFTGNSLSTV